MIEFFVNNFNVIAVGGIVLIAIGSVVYAIIGNLVDQQQQREEDDDIHKPRKISPIRELDEDGVSSSTHHQHQSRMVNFANGNDDHHGGSDVRTPRRRHSTGPLQFAMAATKDFIVRNKRYRRQASATNLRTLFPRPPTEFFEPSDMPEIPDNLSPEVFYILHHLKMLELPADWRLDPQHIEVINLHNGQYLSRPGDPDDCLVVVLEGELAVNIMHSESKEFLVKHVRQGNVLFSMLSMLDVLAGNPSFFRSVSAVAVGYCKVARYRYGAFYSCYANSPRDWIRPIQIINTRLLHVTMTTLHRYLGLSGELVKHRLEEKRLQRFQSERVRHASGVSAGRVAGSIRSKPRRLSSSDESTDTLVTARRYMADVLGLSFPLGISLIQDRMQLVSYADGAVIIEQGSEDEKLFVVITGLVKLMQEAMFEDDDGVDRCIGSVHPREAIGGLQLLTNESSFFKAVSHGSSQLAVMNKTDFDEIVESNPEVVLSLAQSVLRRLSPFLRAVDFALDWVLIDSGQAVYRQGDVADCFYVVLSGRLRSVEKKMTIVEEFGRGDMVGMIELLQKKPRSTTVLAVRYSQLAKVPEGLINFIKLKYPQVGFRLVQLLGHYYYSSANRRRTMLPGGISDPTYSPSTLSSHHDPMSHIKNLHTLAVFPASHDVPLVAFTCELYHALNVNLKVIRLSRLKVAEHLDASVLEKSADFRLMHWLTMQEDTYPLVIYECDYELTEWTRRCLRQADAILVVANGTAQPPSALWIEEHLSLHNDGVRTSKELILLWKEGCEGPTGTMEWLKSGSWFSGHHHISESPSMRVKTLEREVINYYEENRFGEVVDFNSDFSRLARILTGNAVGLVLGGGGARGAAHVGVIKAMREHGIPVSAFKNIVISKYDTIVKLFWVDIVGGTSIGSMIGGLYCESPNAPLAPRARSWFMMMTSLWRKIWDLTYAYSAMFTGAGFNTTLQTLFGDKEIDDLWIPYFCITTNISTSEMRVHRSGPLWLYCRASMSLAGYLPPLCDPVDGHQLLDGGYVNNLPADVMRSLGARCVIAVDVGSATETDLYNHGDSLSGTWLLWRRLNPWSKPMRILGMEEIQSRLAFVSCVRQLEMVKKAPYCHYLRPPIDMYKTLDFGKFDDICEAGYRYGTEIFDDLVKSNANIKSVMNPEKLRSYMTRRNTVKGGAPYDRSLASSFTDLAAQVSKIPFVHNDELLIEEFDERSDSDEDADEHNETEENDDEDESELECCDGVRIKDLATS